MGADQSPLPLLLQPQDVSALLHELYASATGGTRLDAFLDRLCTALGASLASVSMSDHETGRWRYVDYFPLVAEVLRAYETHYADDDPMKAELLRRAADRFYTSDELATTMDPAAYTRWQQWFGDFGYRDLCAAHFPLGEHYSCLVGFARSGTAPAFTRAEVTLLDLLLPHVRQVLSIHARIDQLRILSDIAQEQFAQLGTGCITLNEDKRVNFINSVAREMLRAGNGLLLRDDGLHLSDANADARFQQIQKTCITTSRLPAVITSGVIAAPREDALPLNVVVLPYRTDAAPHLLLAQASHAIVLVFDPARPGVASPLILRELYAFSESEANVCWRIARGESLDEIAAAEQISKETVRSQLKRVFSKTGTSRQSELVRLVLIGPAAVGRLPESWLPASEPPFAP